MKIEVRTPVVVLLYPDGTKIIYDCISMVEENHNLEPICENGSMIPVGYFNRGWDFRIHAMKREVINGKETT